MSMQKKAIIFSDGRVGHENQSRAFCELLELDYEICKVSYSSKFIKILSYLFDFFGIRAKIFKVQILDFSKFDMFVGTGSVSYYALKYYSMKFKKPSVAIMLPNGYKKDFSLIIANTHDRPNPRKNQLILPVSLSLFKPLELYKAGKKSIGFIIGGSNSSFEMSANIVNEIEQIRQKFSGYEFVLTTSPRTPKHVEDALVNFSWDYSVIFSKDGINPIGDFLSQCEWVFISIDSVSMISEAVSHGSASVAIIELNRKKKVNKFDDFIDSLISSGHARKWNGATSKKSLKKTAKYDLRELLKGVYL